MNKDVMISIKGMHFDVSEQGDDIETIQTGQYYTKGQMHYIIFDEPIEGSSNVTKNMIKFNESSMSLTKKGAINTSMLFDTQQKNLTNYSTPYGNLVIGIDTHSISIKEFSNEIRLKVNYSLDVNYEFLTDCDIEIIAHNLDSADI